MRHSHPVRTRWHARISEINPPMELRSWLTDTVSLTAKLTAACAQFRVRLLRESIGRSLDGEGETIGSIRRARIWQREVVLECDGRAVVYARTIVPFHRLAEWPWLHNLGENSLGAALFADPRVSRSAMRFAALKGVHPVRRAMSHAFVPQYIEPLLYARRSKFGFNRNWLLITEVFLPSILQLSKHEPSV